MNFSSNRFKRLAGILVEQKELLKEEAWAILTPKEKKEVELALEDKIDFISTSAYEKLFDYFLNSGEMPYGIAKARSGDPDLWILQQMEASHRESTKNITKEQIMSNIGEASGKMALLQDIVASLEDAENIRRDLISNMKAETDPGELEIYRQALEKFDSIIADKKEMIHDLAKGPIRLKGKRLPEQKQTTNKS